MTKNSFVVEVTFKERLRKWVSDDVILESFDMIPLKCDMYCEDTISGAHGKTATFWMIYCHLLFHGAIKSCKVDLFTNVLHDMSNIFFTTNHQNYVKWMTRYSLELLNLELPLRKMLMNGVLSIQQSKNHFSKVGVDMALEQIINVETKSRLKGTIAFADVNRWLLTSSVHTEIFNKVFNIAGLGPKDDENNNKEVLPTRMKQDTHDLENICKSIRETINPFNASFNKDVLFNIKTGRYHLQLSIIFCQ